MDFAVPQNWDFFPVPQLFPKRVRDPGAAGGVGTKALELLIPNFDLFPSGAGHSPIFQGNGAVDSSPREKSVCQCSRSGKGHFGGDFG